MSAISVSILLASSGLSVGVFMLLFPETSIRHNKKWLRFQGHEVGELITRRERVFNTIGGMVSLAIGGVFVGMGIYSILGT